MSPEEKSWLYKIYLKDDKIPPKMLLEWSINSWYSDWKNIYVIFNAGFDDRMNWIISKARITLENPNKIIFYINVD